MSRALPASRLLLSLPPHIALSEFVTVPKTNTARVLRRDFRAELARWYCDSVLWSRSYCIIGVGGAPSQVHKQYIEQKERPQ